MHKELPLVVIGPASPDGTVVDDRFERIAVPFVERLGFEPRLLPYQRSILNLLDDLSIFSKITFNSTFMIFSRLTLQAISTTIVESSGK